MRKLKHASRHRQRKERSKRAITLALEQLEPRLVLSAVGFGFEATRGQLDSHDRHHGNHEANRPAFAEQFHDKRGDERFEPANRSESDLPSPVRYDHPRGGRSHEPFLVNSLELGGASVSVVQRSIWNNSR